ncbi:MAG: S41 family peptidase [Myxococcota bacterium]|nr:S41 family peptidase [Myxococcota bacterium]
MPRIVRRVLVLSLLLASWAFLGQDRTPIPILLNDAVAGPGAQAGELALGGEPAAGPRAGTERPPHDLGNPKVFTKVILYVKDNYVDPSRVKPKEMMLASLEYVEKTVPDVIVEGSAETGALKVTVNGKARDFDISHVDSLWKMSFTIKDVFRFIGDNMRPMEDTRDVEYAAINGMLSKLDPHSVLLRPELYREMKLTTKGEFGGLGFVIQMKEGNLTVVRVLPKTPAHRAGIKKDDQIKKIGEESTVNMDLNEAVSKLRGAVDSKVSITVERKSWEKPQILTLARAMISIESVQSKLLAKNVGYVRLKNFQGNTTRDLTTALNQMQKEAGQGGLKGLVLDMRGNPGGLLEQAIQVSDLFLSQGTIVATVGLSDKLREEKRAHRDEYDEAFPMAVLVNAGSASASEIVAGALKNLDRAVIIGRQTFGKGSVQVLYDFPDDSALKLTIAKYLTPGDVSIQEVGIVPDIQLVPTRVTEQRLDVFAPRKSMGEADLDSHFGNSSDGKVASKREEVLGKEKSLYELKYLKELGKQQDVAARDQLKEEGKSPKAIEQKLQGSDKKHGERDPLLDVDVQGVDENLDDQMDAETQDEVKEDFEVLFARDYVLAAPATQRQKMLQQGKAFVAKRQVEEEERINGAIGSLGIDWSKGPTPKDVRLSATLTPGGEVATVAGELLELVLNVENKGTSPIKRLRAWTDSENPLLDRREFVFGALAPGQKRTWKVPVRLPKDLTSRRDAVTVKFFDDQGELAETIVSELNFVELPRPTFAFNWQIQDDCQTCNGDGVVQRGEQVTLLVDVTNTGKGAALETFAQIKNGADENIFIEKGRFQIGELAPGATKTARFSFQVKKGYTGETFPLKFAILDEPLEEFSTEKLELPVAQEGSVVEAKKGSLRLSEKAQLLAAPASDAQVIAVVPKASVVSVLGKSGGFYKVEIAKDRFAFVSATEGKEIRGRASLPKELTYIAARTPPTISLNVEPSQGGLVAETDKFTLSGKVEGARRNLDLYVLVNDQKVYFKSVTAQTEGAGFQFTTEFPLKEGNNNVMVVARETQDFASRRSLVIRRRPASWAQQVSETDAKAKVQ